jgi:hypothetical protein
MWHPHGVIFCGCILTSGGARKPVHDREKSISQGMDYKRHAGKAGLTTREPETTFEKMLNAIGDSLSDLASSDDGEYREDYNEDDGDMDQCMLS